VLAITLAQATSTPRGLPIASRLVAAGWRKVLQIVGLDNGVKLADHLPRKNHLKREPNMSKPSKHGPNKAKSIIAQPLFRSRQERPAKGKGSYRREAFQSKSWEASYFLAA
jgi:alternative ribosome-rescue factor